MDRRSRARAGEKTHRSGSRNSHSRRPTPEPTRIDLTVVKHPLEFRWAAAISEDEWNTYKAGMEAVRETGIEFMLGGGFALAAYTGRWRDTKDIDFYILPENRDLVVAALSKAGFQDYFQQRPYDRNWIYRSVRGDVIVDIIWAMANQRARVDREWFERAEWLTLRSQRVSVVPAEEFVWAKLYILQRDHCDWTDIFNVIYANGPSMDWGHLIDRLGEEDLDLLRGMLKVYSWLCPAQVLELPSGLWERLDLKPPPADFIPPTRDRARLLDSRGWFAGTLEEGAKLEV